MLKQRYGKRVLKVEVAADDGGTLERSIPLDGSETAREVEQVFAGGKVLTAHTEEATLEDIFIQITGRGLLG